MKLDKKDVQILKLLSQNCRTPTGHIAKKIGMSRESTHYRIQRLVEKKVITNFTISVDYQKLGFLHHIIFLSFQNAKDMDALVKKIISHPLVGWTTLTPGKWNLIYDVFTQDMSQLDQYLSDLKKQMFNLINEFELTTQLEMDVFPSRYFSSTQGKISKSKKKEIKIQLKEKDIEIIKILSYDARIDLRSISKKINISFPTLKKRMTNLENSGIIKNYTIHFDQDKIGIQRYYAQFNIYGNSLQEEKKFIAYIKSHPNVSSFVRPAVQTSIEVGIFAKNPLEFKKIMNEIRKVYGHVFEIEKIMLLYAEPRGNIIPPGLFPLLLEKL
ncbi:Lrp/AsnC family transcriptional regulator [archaeon]|jgi:DNA-binding Lrp family transcriptional regulator|nr:Lrp/AsnC family transcriptional regulator [archaeon]MBT6761781.1 Lrp/AsnC family transcriptional regulator [archaeon]